MTEKSDIVEMLEHRIYGLSYGTVDKSQRHLKLWKQLIDQIANELKYYKPNNNSCHNCTHYDVCEMFSILTNEKHFGSIFLGGSYKIAKICINYEREDEASKI